MILVPRKSFVTLPSPLIWLDASWANAFPGVSDGQPVNTWYDRSGNNYNLLQRVSNAVPRRDDAAPLGVGVRFKDFANTGLSVTLYRDPIVALQAPPRSAAVVCSVAVDGTGEQFLWGTGRFSSQRWGFAITADQKWLGYTTEQYPNQIDGLISSTANKAIMVLSADATTTAFYVNGVLIGTTGSRNSTGDADGVYVGGNAGALDWVCYEGLHYTAALSAAQVALLTSQLNAKWNVY